MVIKACGTAHCYKWWTERSTSFHIFTKPDFGSCSNSSKGEVDFQTLHLVELSHILADTGASKRANIIFPRCGLVI